MCSTLAPVGNNSRAFFVEGLRGLVGKWLPPSPLRRWGGLQATLTSAPWLRCAMGRHRRGSACKSMLGLRCRWAPFWW